jgi:(2Fe-2S) ferredoxin
MPTLKVTTLEELHKLRAQLRDEVTQRYDVGTTVVVALNDEMTKREMSANVTIDGCIGKCQFEPIVTVHRAGESPVMYGHVTADKVPELIDKLAQGQVIQEWVVT